MVFKGLGVSYFPIFLSVVLVIRNQSSELETTLTKINSKICTLVSDYEIIIVDNSSDDNSISILKKLTSDTGLPNLQIYALTKTVDNDTAAWVGLENSLGDFVAVLNPLVDDIEFLPKMIDEAVSGADVVFANNIKKSPQSLAYKISYTIFNALYKHFNGIHLSKEAPQYRVISKKVVNFILQHSQSAITYRYLPATGGFVRINLDYSTTPYLTSTKKLGESIELGIKLLVSTTTAPMRIVNLLCLFGAVSNLIYSLYVLVIYFVKPDVAAGWASMSIQQSGMFFLLSLVLLVLGEYIIQMASLSNVGPLYHVGQEFTSARMTRREKLNIEEVRVLKTNHINN